MTASVLAIRILGAWTEGGITSIDQTMEINCLIYKEKIIDYRFWAGSGQ
jgi:hypothetical protein